ncbi:MAG TPA: hypothetical protein PLJ39_13895 [Spirochaetota bacterium]|jgi:hypothetical protein|nr:hypothetical protein [Spirochaetota bacterium]HPY03461.1 hypothetical protein [Spirochaetota bacterium]
MREKSFKKSDEVGLISGDRSIRQSRCEEFARQAPRSGALFFRPFLLGDAKEMDKLDFKGAEHLLCIA